VSNCPRVSVCVWCCSGAVHGIHVSANRRASERSNVRIQLRAQRGVQFARVWTHRQHQLPRFCKHCTARVTQTVATHIENLEQSGIWQWSGKMGKIMENVFLVMQCAMLDTK